MIKMEPDEFFAWLVPAVVSVCKQYGVLPSVCMAQAAIESGWGEYIIGEFNLFGRKWGGWGNYIEKETEEYYDGEWQTITAKFQDYSSLEEAVQDYCILLTEEPVYAEVLPCRDELELYVQKLASVYATDPGYGDSILSTIRANDLSRFDMDG